MKKIEKLVEQYMSRDDAGTGVILPRELSIYEAKKKGYQDGIRKGIGLIAELVYHNSLIDDCVVDDAAIVKLLEELEGEK